MSAEKGGPLLDMLEKGQAENPMESTKIYLFHFPSFSMTTVSGPRHEGPDHVLECDGIRVPTAIGQPQA